MRAPDRIVSEALAFGPHIGQFAERLLDAPFPSSKLRQGQRLLRLAERRTPERGVGSNSRTRRRMSVMLPESMSARRWCSSSAY